ncbi:unnamed protein product [Lymnaea stagnalis]|uniref:CUB domain-containing protein n=1 Tax=Lymnaea stagnalis TaxID=6523 RepID=A0AAV2INI6_LYMST
MLNLEATDEDGDATTMELLDNKTDSIRFCKNGTLFYTPNIQEPVIIGIQAKDSKNAFSAIMNIPITVCPICNGHGGYNENIVSEVEYLNGQFTVLKCLCLPAYTGEYCEIELDACKTYPCAKGQNCTDLSAEEQGNMTTGYSCGPCPQGFVDIDMNCLDINECHNTSLCDQLCINTEGSYYCQCGNGFVLSASDNSSCIAIAGKNCSACHCFSTNTHSWLETTRQCICKEGWTGSDCSTKIDNCLNHSCPAHLQCQERKFGYDCVCWNGLKPGPLGTCKDCNRTLSNSNGWIMTSNYPLDYDNDTFCTWTIVSPGSDTTITLSITEYEVEGCPNDYLKIYEGNSTQDQIFGPFCTSGPGVLTTTGGAFHLVFTSDFSITKRGFRGFYSIKDVCLVEKCSHNCEVLAFNPRVEICTCPDWMILDTYNTSRCIEINGCNTIMTASGPIVTPLFPKFYPENVKCFWNISKGNNREITISFSDFEIEEQWDCGYDSVEFLDGPEATSLGKFCGGIAPNITSRNIFLLVVFVSDDSVSGRGFKGKVTIT